ncbi:Uncharacterised protein [Segatella copri]|nr:Uncharacterised protein [Segatella copri]
MYSSTLTYFVTVPFTEMKYSPVCPSFGNSKSTEAVPYSSVVAFCSATCFPLASRRIKFSSMLLPGTLASKPFFTM